MIALALFILGVFLLVAENLRRTIDLWQGSSKVTLYFKDNVTQADIAAVEAHLAKSAFFAKRTFVSSDEAFARFKKHFASLSSVVDQLDHNPFPPSFEVEVSEAIIDNPGFDDAINRLRAMRVVDEVQFDWVWISKVESMINLLNLGGLIAGGILAVAAAFTTANVIRLSLILYREEISIMRLVGANESTIRGPFLLQGLLQGTIGSAVALSLLYIAFAAGRAIVRSSPSFVWDVFFVTFLPWQKLAYLALGGMLAGLIGSWMSLSEFGEDDFAKT